MQNSSIVKSFAPFFAIWGVSWHDILLNIVSVAVRLLELVLSMQRKVLGKKKKVCTPQTYERSARGCFTRTRFCWDMEGIVIDVNHFVNNFGTSNANWGT